MDIRTVAAIAGHSDIKTTMRYLRPVSARKTRDVINQINWEDLNFLGL
jgi:integrase